MIFLSFVFFSIGLTAGDMSNGSEDKYNDGRFCPVSKCQKRSLSSRHLGSKFTKKRRLNLSDCLFHTSFLSTPGAGLFAIEHGERGRLGHGKVGKVKIAQALSNNNSLCAVKIQWEKFDDEEIEGCQRMNQLVAPPVKYFDQDGEKRYAYLQTLIQGQNAWDWLRANDPNTSFSAEQLKELKNKIINALSNQVHEHLMVISDANLENIMIEPNGTIRFIDFGNAILFDREIVNTTEGVNNFMAFRDQDFLMIDAAFFRYLHEGAYPQPVQEELWNDMFTEASKVFEVYKTDRNSPFAYENTFSYLLHLTNGKVPLCITDHTEVKSLENFYNHQQAQLNANSL
jgi:hypothetical protein